MNNIQKIITALTLAFIFALLSAKRVPAAPSRTTATQGSRILELTPNREGSVEVETLVYNR